MAITLVHQYSRGKLVYLTGGAYEFHYYDGRVLIHTCNRRSKSNDVKAKHKLREYYEKKGWIVC